MRRQFSISDERLLHDLGPLRYGLSIGGKLKRQSVMINPLNASHDRRSGYRIQRHRLHERGALFECYAGP